MEQTLALEDSRCDWIYIDHCCDAIMQQRDKQIEQMRNQLKRKKLSQSERKRKHEQEELQQKQQVAQSVSAASAKDLQGGLKEARRKKRFVPPVYLPKDTDPYISELRQCLGAIYRSQNGHVEWQLPYEGGFTIARCLLHLLFADKHYCQVHEAIRMMDLKKVPKIWVREIDEFWDYSSYHIDSRKPFEKLNPVNKYRIRKNIRSPLCAIYGERRYSFNATERNFLSRQYSLNSKPTTEEKLAMSRKIGVRIDQVSNYFKNRRQRRRASSFSSLSTASSSSITYHNETKYLDLDIKNVPMMPLDIISQKNDDQEANNASAWSYQTYSLEVCDTQVYMRNPIQRTPTESPIYYDPSLTNTYHDNASFTSPSCLRQDSYDYAQQWPTYQERNYYEPLHNEDPFLCNESIVIDYNNTA